MTGSCHPSLVWLVRLVTVSSGELFFWNLCSFHKLPVSVLVIELVILLKSTSSLLIVAGNWFSLFGSFWHPFRCLLEGASTWPILTFRSLHLPILIWRILNGSDYMTTAQSRVSHIPKCHGPSSIRGRATPRSCAHTSANGWLVAKSVENVARNWTTCWSSSETPPCS